MSDDPFRSLLRPSESLKCLLNVQLAPENTNQRTNTPLHRRWVALLTHYDHEHERDLGSILVLSPACTANGQATVLDALPVTERLVLQFAQIHPINPHMSDTDPNVPTEMWSAWLLTIRRDAQDPRPLECIVRTRDIQKLQNLTAEYRRLKEIATATHPADADFTWTDVYFLHSSRRLDLRLRRQPLHTRLSPAIAGSQLDDLSDISIVQHDWIERAAAKASSKENQIHLKIRFGTFNVSGKTPSQDLYPWLRGAGSQTPVKPGWISPLKLSPFEVSPNAFHKAQNENYPLADKADGRAFGEPDMLVLGFQELDQSTEALIYATSTLREEEWLTAIFAGLGEKHVLYEKLTSRQLVGMLIIIIVKKALTSCFTDIRSCDVGSGIMGLMGNKGATAVRLEFTPKDSQITCRPTIFTFVNAHLAASDEMVDRRHYDFQNISGRLAFAPPDLNESYPATLSAGDTYDIYQCDALFWMGDLNYRLDLPDRDVRKLLSLHTSGVDSIPTLLSYDQLRDAIRNEKAFSGFAEPHIAYLPTYRLAAGMPCDQLGYNMKRKPAWTDRVLYMTSPDVEVQCVAYRGHAEITMSDHKPVSADFDISLPLIDQSQYENLLSTLRRELGGHDNSERQPKIKVQPTSIELGTVRYKQAIHREVAIKNEGETACMFRFVGTGGNSEHTSPSWLRIEPIVGLLRPHESTTVTLIAYVDNDSAAQLNLCSSKLECTLILHTALGKDDFLTISGNYQYTCFANTLERLTRLAGPIRRLKSPEDTVPAEQAINAPREIMRLISWLMTHASTTDALFEDPAEERLCHVIRECLDTGDEFPSEGLDQRALCAAFASTLVAFFDSLPEPVVPARLHAQCLQARDKDEALDMLNVFPHESINVWISLTASLHYIALQGRTDTTGSPSKAHKLASIFAPVLLRDDPSGDYPRASPVGKHDFFLHFID